MMMWSQRLDPGQTISLPPTEGALVMGIVVREATSEEAKTSTTIGWCAHREQQTAMSLYFQSTYFHFGVRHPRAHN
jgi:hypothetical protein